jgi:hypothetical protein
MTGLSGDLLAAWQQALAAEQRAVFGYGLLGPRLADDSAVGLAHDCQSAHEQLRDAAAAAITGSGRQPAAPASDYPDLYPVNSASAAGRLAVRLEEDAASAWRYVYAVAAAAASDASAGSGSLRRTAQAALTASAVRATRWRLTIGVSPPVVAFPGI